jgi:hypothetical protein
MPNPEGNDEWGPVLAFAMATRSITIICCCIADGGGAFSAHGSGLFAESTVRKE